ncbi:MAG TPA: hypothetical protein ENH82_10510, partial [bacterium]|nr:hypothetical protein [bacterium]
MTIKTESGEKREFSTGAKKQVAKGKGTPVLFPPDAYLEISKHFEEGAEHYSARNWEKGIPLSELINSLERHIAQEKMGLTDESHDRAIAWCAICYLATKLRIAAEVLPKELDDLEGAYREQAKPEPIETETERKEVNFTICMQYINGFPYFYVYESISRTYLHSDLQFYEEMMQGSDGLTGYFNTRGDADACIQRY